MQYIYVIGADGTFRVKIGFASDPTQRLTSLQAASPFPLSLFVLLPGGRTVESQLHRQFEPYRQRGEWFDFGSADPVLTVVQAWAGLRDVNAATPLPVAPRRERNGPTEEDVELLRATRRCYRDDEGFVPTVELIERLLRLPGDNWWQCKWEHAGPRTIPMDLGRVLSLFGARKIRRQENGAQHWGYLKPAEPRLP